MKIAGFCMAALFIASLVATAQATLNEGAGAYATGKYRNLFKEDGHSEKEIRV